MTQVLIVLSLWLHNVGTIILIGHHLLLSVIYLPILASNNKTILSQISKRSRPWMYISLLIFMFTGTYLTLANPNYLGFADFGNVWSLLMLVKHLLVLGIIGMGFWFNAILRIGPMMSSNNGGELATRRFRLYANLMAISGLLTLLLTAVAQVE